MNTRGRKLSCYASMLVLAIAAAPATADPSWPTAVEAHYRLRFNGFDVGHLTATTTVATAISANSKSVNASSAGTTYSMRGSGKFSALFGAVIWTGSSSASGSITKGTPHPAAFEFNWSNKRKKGYTRIGFKNRTAHEIAVVPPPDPHKDIVALSPSHMEGLDPISALLMLTKADSRPPCERTVGIFDGKQRYDIVLTPKRMTTLPSASKGSPPEVAYVCRVMYVPIAGHRDNESTKTARSNKDVELVMRRVPGTDMLVPFSVTVPTFWGTGALVTDRIEITTASGQKIAFAK